jgi:protein-disulfide isomerase
VAQRGRKQSSKVPGTVSGGPRGTAPSGKGSGSRPGKGPAAGAARSRQSVAAARRSNGDRTQLIIGGVAVVVIIAIIVVGLVLYQKNTAVQGSGYGVSKSSTASVDDKGIITVSNGNPSLVLDVYEDGLCPACANFEAQYGQQIAKAIDDGQLTVRYHMVNFLNDRSHSGTYSTRAYAALMAVAQGDGDRPGMFMKFHSALYEPDNQPDENGSSDLSNAQLASLAGSIGASQQTQDAISNGIVVTAAGNHGTANVSSLKALAAKAGSSSYGTPTVAKDGSIVSIQDVDWLTRLLPSGSASGASTPSGTGSAAPTS